MSAVLKLAYDWKQDGDLMVCRKCGRKLNIAYAHEKFPHSSDCLAMSDVKTQMPWLRLKDALEIDLHRSLHK